MASIAGLKYVVSDYDNFSRELADALTKQGPEFTNQTINVCLDNLRSGLGLSLLYRDYLKKFSFINQPDQTSTQVISTIISKSKNKTVIQSYNSKIGKFLFWFKFSLNNLSEFCQNYNEIKDMLNNINVKYSKTNALIDLLLKKIKVQDDDDTAESKLGLTTSIIEVPSAPTNVSQGGKNRRRKTRRHTKVKKTRKHRRM